MADVRICSVDGCDNRHFGRGFCNAHYYRWRKHGHPMMGGPALSAKGSPLAWMAERLHHGGADCLIWPFARNRNGYGSLKVMGRQINAHRWVCEQVHGPAPSQEHQAAHSCGKGRDGCVNPSHLRWATPSENAADKVLHGTTFRGKPGPHRKLTVDQVREIRALKGAVSQSELASRFGATQANIGLIQRRKTWAWLDQ